MKPTCLIIDDEPVAAAGLAEDLKAIDMFTIEGLASSASQATELYAMRPVDLLFLDIEMPGRNGLEFLKTLEIKPMVILVSAYQQYALQGYEHGVIDYLVKPVSPARLRRACEKAIEQYNLRLPAGTLVIKCDGHYHRIGCHEITHLEAANNYVWVHTTDKRYMVYQTLRALEQQLPETQFIQIHKSFVVSQRHIRQVTGDAVILPNAQIPLSRRFRAAFLRRLTTNPPPLA